MKLLCFFLLLVTVSAQDFLKDEHIEFLNKQNLSWKAGRNFDSSMTLSDIRKLLGVKTNNNLNMLLSTRSSNNADLKKDILESFDAREIWKNCTSIKMIRDQSKCGSCWALAAVEAMSDRICIHSRQKNQTLVSAADLLSCCTKCGDGCKGGYPAAAWEFWHTDGIVTGGDFNSSEGCQDYPFPSCLHHMSQDNETEHCDNIEDQIAPTCTANCTSQSDYKSEKTWGEKPYAIPSIEKDIQIEIIKNGPVEASFDVYEDFLAYQSGVYERTKEYIGENTVVGQHAVKIIGWGVDNSTSESKKYWLIANSWNEKWGEKGFFRILRGVNHCGIESNIVAGLPIGSDNKNDNNGSHIILIASSANVSFLMAIALLLKLW